jgi:hypothetical protein
LFRCLWKHVQLSFVSWCFQSSMVH